VSLHPFLTAPETHPTLRRTLFDDDPDAERYEEWAARVRLDGNPDCPPFPYKVQHPSGEPTWVQDDVRFTGVMFNRPDGYWAAVACRPADPALTMQDAWAVLLGLHADDAFGLEIHDGGAIQILAPVADLAAGRLARLLCSVDSG
jgi:hypothetical protein